MYSECQKIIMSRQLYSTHKRRNDEIEILQVQVLVPIAKLGSEDGNEKAKILAAFDERLLQLPLHLVDLPKRLHSKMHNCTSNKRRERRDEDVYIHSTNRAASTVEGESWSVLTNSSKHGLSSRSGMKRSSLYRQCRPPERIMRT